MIYFAKDTVTQAIKIGFSKRPKDRVGSLQTGNPSKLILLGTISGTANDETAYHCKFATYKLEGEWFRGEIIEEVLEIIASHKQNRLAMRRRTVIEETGSTPAAEGLSVPAMPAGESAVDKDAGCAGVCRIPGLRMKSFSMRLTESPYEERLRAQGQNAQEAKSNARGQIICGVEIKYLLVFERDFGVELREGKASSELEGLRTFLCSCLPNTPLVHRFYDEENALIPYCPDNSASHIVGGREAVTGAKGDAFRVLLAYEKTLNPNHPSVKLKDAYMGENYTGEHPLKRARRFVVSGTYPAATAPATLVGNNEDVLRTTASANERKEIPVPEGWYYWTHTSNGGKEEIIRDGQGRVIGLAVHGGGPGSATLAVTIRRKQDA
jgi:hypothetical protein